jgi:hypothetical protein
MNPNPCLCAFEAEESVWLAGGLRPDDTAYSESTESYKNTKKCLSLQAGVDNHEIRISRACNSVPEQVCKRGIRGVEMISSGKSTLAHTYN